MKSKSALAAAVLLALGVLGAGPAPDEKDKKDDKKDEKKWDVENPPYPMPVRSEDRHGRGDVDEPRRLSRRERDRLRPARRHLLDPDRRRRGARADLGRRLGHAAALLARRQAHRVHFRPLRRRQHLGHGPRRHRIPSQVTKETFRLTNSPAWTPDGEFIAARKHFTGTRSLGSGEIWLYHRTGGEGLQMTKRPDRAEGRRRAGVLARRPLPLLQPGRHAGADLPVQQGPQRRDLRDRAARPRDRAHRPLRLGTGRLGPADALARRQAARVRAARCAARPCSSSRTSTPAMSARLFDGLERDMQETWAIHGVYPDAWRGRRTTARSCCGPAARSASVDAESGASSVIPFHVTGHAQGSRGRAIPGRRRAGALPGADAALGRGLAARRPGRLSGARAHLGARSAGGDAAASDVADGSLRALSLVLARRRSGSSSRPGTTRRRDPCAWRRRAARARRRF